MTAIVAVVTSVSSGLAYLFTTESEFEPVIDMRAWPPTERLRVGDWLQGQLDKNPRRAVFVSRIQPRFPTLVSAQNQLQLESVVVFAPPEVAANSNDNFGSHSTCWSPGIGRVGYPPNFIPPAYNVAYSAWIAYTRWNEVNERRLNVKWMLVEHNLTKCNVQCDVDNAPWNRKNGVYDSVVDMIAGTYRGLVVMRTSANCVLIFSESYGLIACPCGSCLKVGSNISFRLKPSDQELLMLTGCRYAADEVQADAQAFSCIPHHNGLTIVCDRFILPKLDEITGKLHVNVDVIGTVVDVENLITTKMLYQNVCFRATWMLSNPNTWTISKIDSVNRVPYEKFKEKNFVLADGTEKIVNAIGMVSRIFDADGYMFVWTLGVQPDVILRMEYCDDVKTGDWVRFSASRTPPHNRFMGEGRAVKTDALLETSSDRFPPWVKTTVTDDGERIMVDKKILHRVFSVIIGYVLDDHLLICEDRYGSPQFPRNYQVWVTRIKPICECSWRVKSFPQSAHLLSTQPILRKVQLMSDRRLISMENVLPAEAVPTADQMQHVSSDDGDIMARMSTASWSRGGSRARVEPPLENRASESMDVLISAQHINNQTHRYYMETLKTFVRRMLDDERIAGALKKHVPVEYERFMGLF